MQHAFATVILKTANDDAREFTGTASTPSCDRAGDIVEPTGAIFATPMPLLWEHDQRQPIGHVIAASVTPSGITVRAKLVKVAEPGTLRDRLDTAWQSIRAGLVRGLSIGFIPVPGDSEPLKSGGRRFRSWRWVELSACVIPMNADCSITAVKAAFTNRQPRPVVYLHGSPRRPGAVYLDR